MQVPEGITAIEGLPGYRPPEYGDRKFSTLSDVYSYGVVSLVAIIFVHVYNVT